MDDLISRQAAIDALAEQMPQPYTPDGLHPADEGIFMAQEIYADCIQTLEDLPPAQPEQRTEALKAEIRRMKRSFTTCINSDYYTGYMSALSAVEGYIAQWEGETNA